MNRIPRVIAINDMSGFGRCSLTTAIPVLSVLGVQCCPLPTAILSCHTGFNDFTFKDLTSILPKYLSNWKSNEFEFDCIYSGFLGSFEQIEITSNLIATLDKNTLCVIDTVMGDHGKIYSTYTQQMCEGMKNLIAHADVITPNITEACYLAGIEYKGEDVSKQQAIQIAEKLCNMGANSVVITGIDNGQTLSNLVYENNTGTLVSTPKSKKVFSGTGDLFASIVTGMLLNNNSLEKSVEVAANYIYNCIEYTIQLNSHITEGVVFEPLLKKLGDNLNV